MRHIKKLTIITGLCGLVGVFALLTYFQLTKSSSYVPSYVDTIGSILGVETSLERQTKWINSKKIEEAEIVYRDIPNPTKYIEMEGRLVTDTLRKNTEKSLDDLRKYYLLAYSYKITGNRKYLDRSKLYLIDWANTYVATGNPINESHLQQFFEGYAWTRSSMDTMDVQKIDNWLRTIADKGIQVKYNDDRDSNNWNSHRINIIGQIGFLIEDDEYINYAVDAFKQQVHNNLLADGSSKDFISRDALRYHSYNIWPLLNFAKTASLHGIDLYSYKSVSGSSLRKSVHFLFPYFSGQKTHKEFVNSTVAWDTKTGSKKLTEAAAKNWVPRDDLYILELAYYFDDEVLPLVQKIRNTKAEFPSFETMLAYTQRNESITISTPNPNTF